VLSPPGPPYGTIPTEEYFTLPSSLHPPFMANYNLKNIPNSVEFLYRVLVDSFAAIGPLSPAKKVETHRTIRG